MSSTKRSGQRQASDYYVTPLSYIRDFLRAATAASPEFYLALQEDPILDPCAGGDDNHAMAYPEVLKDFTEASVLTVDIREDSRAQFAGVDYLEWQPSVAPMVTISNPPFALAEEFIRKALRESDRQGFVAFLLRLSFFESDKRFPLWRDAMPYLAFVHRKRPSFTGDGRTDSAAYMHALWRVRSSSEFSRLKVI